jgi:hypothetical protein
MPPPRKKLLLLALASMLVALGVCQVATPASFAAKLRRVIDGTGGKDTIRGNGLDNKIYGGRTGSSGTAATT